MYSEMEATALRSLAGLKPEQAKDRQGYMKTVLLARQMRVGLLQDLGFIDRTLGGLSFSIRADDVRRALRGAGLLSEIRSPEAVPSTPPTTTRPARITRRLRGTRDGDVPEGEIEHWLKLVDSQP